MKEDKPVFGRIRQRKNFLEEYVGEYIVIYTPNRSRGGCLRGFDENNDYAILSPFQAVSYRKGSPHYILRQSKKGCRIRLSDIIEIEPISRTSLMEYCDYQNQQIEEKRTQEEKNGRPKK